MQRLNSKEAGFNEFDAVHVLKKRGIWTDWLVSSILSLILVLLFLLALDYGFKFVEKMKLFKQTEQKSENVNLPIRTDSQVNNMNQSPATPKNTIETDMTHSDVGLTERSDTKLSNHDKPIAQSPYPPTMEEKNKEANASPVLAESRGNPIFIDNEIKSVMEKKRKYINVNIYLESEHLLIVERLHQLSKTKGISKRQHQEIISALWDIEALKYSFAINNYSLMPVIEAQRFFLELSKSKYLNTERIKRVRSLLKSVLEMPTVINKPTNDTSNNDSGIGDNSLSTETNTEPSVKIESEAVSKGARGSK